MAEGARATYTAPPLPAPVLDSHTHLDAVAARVQLAPTPSFVTQTMAQAREVGVLAAITVADTVDCSRWCVAAARAHRDVYAAVAVHPTEVGGLDEAGYAELEQLASDPNVVAIGETGLDYYWDTTRPADQRHHFRRHIDLAKRAGKPLMIHDREAHDDVLRILDDEGAPQTVVFHAFSGDAAMARRCADAGYYMSFAGVITFKNAPSLREAAAQVPADLLLVETDAPFLTPHPLRGRPNAPRLLPLTVLGLADAIGAEPDQLCAALARNAATAFGIQLVSDGPAAPG